MLDDRKAAILRAVVEEYIDTAQPVGSAHVVKAADVKVSSATVRNDMATLENEGYLRQPHTSAGRIPTEKGYRFFVDHLRSEEHTSELQSLMRISYAVFCLKKKKNTQQSSHYIPVYTQQQLTLEFNII